MPTPRPIIPAQITPEEIANVLAQVQLARTEAANAASAADAASKTATDTHRLVLEIHLGLMQPPQGQEKSLLYQFAQMLEEWKRHKWAFQTVIYLAGAVVTLAAAMVAWRNGFGGTGGQQ